MRLIERLFHRSGDAFLHSEASVDKKAVPRHVSDYRTARHYIVQDHCFGFSSGSVG